MSLRLNILANYASQLYVTGVGILILPLYIRHMGAEAYGLVGFFTLLQAWFALLDLGLTPTIGRETARYRGGAMAPLAYRQLFRALSLIFAAIALLGGGALWLLAAPLAQHWLKASELPLEQVVLAVQIMAISVALRWMGGLYRGVIGGCERLVWLSAFNALIGTLRFVAVFASMALFGFTPQVFFTHQLLVALLELLGLLLMSYRLLPARRALGAAIGWSLRPVRPLLGFALSIAFTSSLWVLVTQTDKLLLSGILPLAEYAHFTLAVLAASGIMVISTPISSAILPRLTRLHAEGRHAAMLKVYREATQFTSVLAGSAAITLALCAEPLLFAWTGDRQLAVSAAPIMRLYALGNGLLTLVAFAYYLQYAQGNLRYHLIGNTLMSALLIPCLVVAALHHGGHGAGVVWLGFNALSLLLWVAYIHHKLEPGLHLGWLGRDVLRILLPALLLPLTVIAIGTSADSRLGSLALVLGIGLLTLLGALAGTDLARQRLHARLKKCTAALS